MSKRRNRPSGCGARSAGADKPLAASTAAHDSASLNPPPAALGSVAPAPDGTASPAERSSATSAQPSDRLGRIDIIDALRGLSIILMVIYHGLYDAVYYLSAPEWLFSNPVFDFLNRFFEVIFILLSGISCRLSRSNIKRGLIFWAGAIAVSVVTHIIDNPIRFGILHFMGSAAILFGLYQLIRSKLPARTPAPNGTASSAEHSSASSAQPSERSAQRRSDISRIAVILVCIALFILGWRFSYGRVYSTEWFFWLGMRYPGFYSSDWFPLIPWIFVYIAGTAIGLWVKERRFPSWFYTKKIPFLAAAGRKTLIIYLAHQPILFGITMFIRACSAK